jgi:1-acyl-sn-glycerol-3-phosphate acyltransferase
VSGRSRAGRLKDEVVRASLRFVVGAYVRVRVSGAERLPDEPYLICINHPSWTDPLVAVAYWPDRHRRLWIFGPRERDMSRGWRNAVIRWSERGVPFKPRGADVLDATRRATAVLNAGGLLLIAGEGRLSDHEGRLLPLETGVGHFAMMAGVPVVPAAVSGTQWLRLGKTVRIRIGEPVPVTGWGRGRTGAAALTARVEADLQRLLDELAPHDDRRPGPFARWLSDAFNERPWLTEGNAAQEPESAG